MAQLVGVRTTNQSASVEGTLVRDVGEDIVLLEPNATPLITLTMKMKNRKPVYSPRVEWLEDDYVARWGQNGSATISAATASTTVTVSDGTLFAAEDLVLVPKAVSSSAAPEMFRVVSVSGNVLTVIRNVGTGTIGTIDASAALRILGSAAEENATPQSQKSTNVATLTTYTQIFKTIVSLSGTQEASRIYGSPGGERKRLHKKKLVEHKQKMNAQALFGKASESLTGGPNGNPVRTTAGINSRITTNITDAGGILTQKTFESFARAAFRYGSQNKLLLASPIVISAIHAWGNSFMQLGPMEKQFGVDIQKVTSGHGQFTLARDWMLEDGVSGQNGFGGVAFCIDMENFEYVFLSENGKSRDTRIEQDVVKDGRDGVVDEILTEAGFRIRHEKKHAKLFNVTDYSA